MVVLGVDRHQDTHTVVAVDQAGRQLGQTTVAARTPRPRRVDRLATPPLARRAGVGGGGLPPCHWPAGMRPAGGRGAGGGVPPRLLAGAPWSVQVGIGQELTVAMGALTAGIDRLAGQLGQRVAQLAPNLLSLPGCGC